MPSMDDDSPSRTSRNPSLTDLPNHLVIDDILPRLPIKEAIRTSILCKSWRSHWQFIPELRLTNLTRSEISHVLRLHSAPIRLFEARKENSSEKRGNLDSWLAKLSRASPSVLHTLILEFDGNLDVTRFAGCFRSITHLQLSFCCLSIASHLICDFPHVQTLHLRQVTILDGEISKLISACPLVETLVLMYIQGRPSSLNIVAPNLRWIKLFDVEFVAFTITSAPLLQGAIIHRCIFKEEEEADSDDDDDDDDDDSDDDDDDDDESDDNDSDEEEDDDIENELPGYQWFLGRGHVLERNHTCFNHLRILWLDANFGDLEMLPVIFRLLNSIPNIEELRIKHLNTPSNVLEATPAFWTTQRHGNLFYKLERVTIWNFRKERELDFIKYLLAKARILKMLMIVFHPKVQDKGSIMAKLLEFPRVSNQASIRVER